MQKIKVQAIKENFYQLISEKWMLITAGSGENYNTMTASWGHLGSLWNNNLPTSIIYIRPSRYTKKFVDENPYYSLSFFNNEYKEDLSYLGSHSGRDENKVAKTQLHVEYDKRANYFKEADLVLICRKLYKQDLKEECFIDQDVMTKSYPLRDFHTMYVGQIEEVLIK